MMKTGAKFGTVIALATMLGTTMVAPMAASADNYYQQQNHVQNQKNTDRNIAIGGAALGLLGFLSHNNALGIVGTAGAVIAGSQYEQTRHDQSVQQNRDQRDWRGNDNNNYGWGQRRSW
jgi:hypothetical protein